MLDSYVAPEGVEVKAEDSSAQEKATAIQDVAKRLADAEATFKKWFGPTVDIQILHAIAATAAAERIVGDPLWLLIVGGSGSIKTEGATTLDVMGWEVVSNITSVGALLSGTTAAKDKETGEEDKDATGGLLMKIGTRGGMVLKDVTSILSLPHSTRGTILAALREIYDGKWVRNLGNRGGRTLVWEGKIGLLGGVTTAWDTHHEVISAMGDRFLLLRLDTEDRALRLAAGKQSMANVGKEAAMRRELRSAVGSLLSHLKGKTINLPLSEHGDVEDELLTIANIATTARTAVVRDYHGNVIDAHAPEMPTRFLKQLSMLLRGGLAIGLTFGAALDLALRVAQDSIPPLRKAILMDVSGKGRANVKEISGRLEKPYQTVKREVDALHMLGILRLLPQAPGETGAKTFGVEPDWADAVSKLVTRKVSTGGREGGEKKECQSAEFSGNGPGAPCEPDVDMTAGWDEAA